ncbi:hypothetical protein QWJ07_32160 [Frankia sp. RB7]|nr:hypothetical protein [Frankia sp. RB7]
MQRINVSKSIILDPIEKSLCLRYEEVIALRKAVRRESSVLAAKRIRRSGTKQAHVNGK